MWIPLAVGAAALAWSAWRYGSSLPSVFADSDGPKDLASSTVESQMRQEGSVDDDDVDDVLVDDRSRILLYPRSDEIVYGGERNVYGSSWSSVFSDSDAPKDLASTVEIQMLQEWLVNDVLVDDKILPSPRSDKIVDRGIIKIMTYNIWSVEGVKINKRMKAIGKLIKKHAPDMILLQEVTPMIYEIFQKCDWWGLYECPVSPKKPKRNFFCMLLSKLPMKRSYYKNFEDTQTGKGLYVANIKTRANKKLVVATCHLKRPTPPEMNSTERLSQANEALRSLQSAPNVILGGDMNWDDSSDGPFPLLGKWVDAWSNLRPEQDGWTYDSKSNEMLHHKRKVLQKRLDRFICKLKNFEMVSIYMIGTEAIPNVTYKSKGERLPVLPSDHYGLMLEIMPKQ